MRDNYEDIMTLPHHVSQTRPQMSMEDRAAQFSPFAALTGYDAAIKETARQTQERVELDEYEKEALNEQLQLLAERLPDEPPVRITYFQPDARKEGGAYVNHEGTVKRIATYERMLIMTDKVSIPLDEIIEITFLQPE